MGNLEKAYLKKIVIASFFVLLGYLGNEFKPYFPVLGSSIAIFSIFLGGYFTLSAMLYFKKSEKNGGGDNENKML